MNIRAGAKLCGRNPDAGARQRRSQQRRRRRHVEIPGLGQVIGVGEEGERADRGHAGGQPVQAIDEVDRVDGQDGEQDRQGCAAVTPEDDRVVVPRKGDLGQLDTADQHHRPRRGHLTGQLGQPVELVLVVERAHADEDASGQQDAGGLAPVRER
jgi:hypothetical protein